MSSVTSGARTLAVCGVAAIFLLPAVAHAECRPSQPLAQCAPDERAERLELALTQEAHSARTWRYVWTGINGALAVGSFALLPITDEEDHPDFIVGGVGSLLMTTLTFFFPLEVESNAREAVEVRRLPREQRLARLELLTSKSAEDARLRKSLPFHVVNLAGSSIAGGIIAFGYDHHASGILTGVAGFVLGETQLFTQPVGPAEASELSQKVELRPYLRLTQDLGLLGISGVF